MGSGKKMTPKELRDFKEALKITPDEIKKLREDCGLTVREFSEIFLITDSGIEQWESGESTPNAYYLTILMQLRKKVDKIGDKEKAARIIKDKFSIGIVYTFLTWLYSDISAIK